MPCTLCENSGLSKDGLTCPLASALKPEESKNFAHFLIDEEQMKHMLFCKKSVYYAKVQSQIFFTDMLHAV